jgi:hypothetical protein
MVQNQTKVPPTNQNHLQQPQRASKPPKRRVTAIRSNLIPGLYDQGIFVDKFCNQHLYYVEELPVALDKEIYVGSYFVNIEEELFVYQQGKFVHDINQYIEKVINS